MTGRRNGGYALIVAAAVLFAACGPRTPAPSAGGAASVSAAASSPAPLTGSAPSPAPSSRATPSAPAPPATTPTTTATTTPTTTPVAPAPLATASPTSSLARLAQEPAVGVQFHATWQNYSASDRVTILDKLAAAGAEWVRIDVGWASYEPKASGQIDAWYRDRVDAAVNEARARGLKVLLTPWMTPGWANVNAGTTTPPADPAEYARFLTWLSTRLAGKVQAYEIWNEPNDASFWTGSTVQYADLLKASYPALKAGDPAALVVLGGPSYNDSTWISTQYQLGIKGSFDVMATHPYQGVANKAPETADDGTIWNFTHVTAVRNLMVANGDAQKPIWFTEFGWSNHAPPSGAANWMLGVTDEQQSEYLIRSLRWIATQAPYVTQVFWYNDRNQTTGNPQIDNYGLLTKDLAEKSVYRAMREYLT